MIVGDAMARPLTEVLAAANKAGKSYDTSSLFVIGSGGAILSASSKDSLRELLPNVFVVDGFGSSETGVLGTQTAMGAAGPAGAPRFSVNDQTTVLGDDGRPLVAGSGAVGRLARRGHVPIGYYKDQAKTALMSLTIDGMRWALPSAYPTSAGASGWWR